MSTLTSTLALAIQTIPDIETGRRLHNIGNLSDLGVAKAMFHLQQQRTGSEDLPLYLQKIVSIAIAYERAGKLYIDPLPIDVLVDNHQHEQRLLQRYVNAVKGQQQITWQGSRYDFPILRYRALKQGIKLAENRDINDTMLQVDLSLQFEPERDASASLADISCLLALPCLEKLNQAEIWQAYLAKDYTRIDNCTKAQAANIYRIHQAM